jgi:hypothetical protein
MHPRCQVPRRSWQLEHNQCHSLYLFSSVAGAPRRRRFLIQLNVHRLLVQPARRVFGLALIFSRFAPRRHRAFSSTRCRRFGSRYDQPSLAGLVSLLPFPALASRRAGLFSFAPVTLFFRYRVQAGHIVYKSDRGHALHIGAFTKAPRGLLPESRQTTVPSHLIKSAVTSSRFVSLSSSWRASG